MIVLDLVWEAHPTRPMNVLVFIDPPNEPRTYTWQNYLPPTTMAHRNSTGLSWRPLPEPLQSFVLAAHEQAMKESHS